MEKNISKKVKINNVRLLNKMGLLRPIHLVIHMLSLGLLHRSSVHDKEDLMQVHVSKWPFDYSIIIIPNPRCQLLFDKES